MANPALAYEPVQYKEVDWDYSVANDVTCDYAVTGGLAYSNNFLTYHPRGELTLHRHYSCDGPSIPGGVGHRPWNLRAAFFHDGHYQLGRLRRLTTEAHRKQADLIFLRMMREDIDTLHSRIDYSKRNWLTRRVAKAYNAAERRTQRASALVMYSAVRQFSKSHFTSRPRNQVHVAP